MTFKKCGENCYNLAFLQLVFQAEGVDSHEN